MSKQLKITHIPFEGTHVIEASAGTGKTYTIAHLYLRVLLEKEMPVDTIVVVTFTEAATEELRGRIREILRIAYDSIHRGISLDNHPDIAAILKGKSAKSTAKILRTALSEFDNAAIFTIHGFCSRILRDHAFATGHIQESELTTDASPIIEDTARDFYRRVIATADVARFTAIKEAKINLNTLIEWGNKYVNRPTMEKKTDTLKESEDKENISAEMIKEFFDYFPDAYKKKKQQLNVYTFDDILLNVYDAIQKDSESDAVKAISKHYSAALIDEFQDTDPVQYEIFSTLFKTKPCYFIGDPKQAIYSFRGADVYTYLQAKSSANMLPSLTVNWRSQSTLIDAFNYIFDDTLNDNTFKNSAIPYEKITVAGESKGNKKPLKDAARSAENSLYVWKHENSSKENARISCTHATVREIVRLLNEGENGRVCIGDEKIKPADIAILTMSHKEAQTVRDALIHSGVPAVVQKSGSVFDSEEATWMKYFLHALADPTDTAMIHTVLTTPLCAYSLDDLYAFIHEETKQKHYEEDCLEPFRAFYDVWQKKGFMFAFRRFLKHYSVRQHLTRTINGERRLTNLLHLAELLHEAETSENLRGTAVLSWLEQRCAQKDDEKSVDKYLMRLESDDDAVKIMTVYASKGLEFPVVFCPFMWSRSYSYKDSLCIFHENDKTVFDPYTKSESVEKVEEENLAELIRLLYVAVTRARNRCYLVIGEIGRGSDTTSVKNVKSLLKLEAEDATLPDGIAVESVMEETQETDTYSAEGKNAEEVLKPRNFTGAIDTNWRMTSYSFLKQEKDGIGHERHVLKTDEIDETEAISTTAEVRADTLKEKIDDTINSFPRGTLSGTCIHEICEKADFTEVQNESEEGAYASMIDSVLAKYSLQGIDDKREEYIRTIQSMLKNTFTTPLPSGDENICLAAVSKEQTIREMPFVFPVKSCDVNMISRAVEKATGTDFSPGMLPVRDRLHFSPFKGIFTGIIDLVFMHNDMFYLLDWKTNYLGDSLDDYTPENLTRAMDSSLYTLQYSLYTYALHLYLKNRIEEYSYKTHFGGVLYVFMRGITAERPGNGVFFARPEEECIELFSKIHSD